MARRGPNPGREQRSGVVPERITVAMLVCVPSLDGYYRYRFEVLKLALAALEKHTQTAHDLMVFDNGSMPEVGEFLNGLKQQGVIDYLLSSSRNIGNFGALQMMLASAPGEIVAYLDEDVFVYPGWLPAQLKILEAYPQVGMVSGVPVRIAAQHAASSLNNWLESAPEGLEVKRERLIPDEWELDWARSTGRQIEAFVEETKTLKDTLINFNGVEAFGSANHFQFTGYREVLLRGLPEDWDQRLMGDMVEFDNRLDGLGYLRLSTPGRYVRHIGNTISEDLGEEARSLGLDQVRPGEVPVTRKHWILYLPRSRKILKAIYNWLFKVLFLHDKLR
jgi:glycosyltransferase involved in cell wall biosynthesis